MQLWFLDTLVDIRVASADGEDGMTLIESVAPRGDSPPLHVHEREDELFHVLDGQLTLMVDGRERVLRAGESALAPKGIAHTYRVDSQLARWLVTTTRGEFERFVRAMSRTAEGPGLPERSAPPTAEQQAALAAVAAAHGIALVGPPLAIAA
jgi:quercetin dioxygenase-like cupin family protein